MRKWLLALFLLTACAAEADENTAVHNIGIQLFGDAKTGGSVRIYVISFVSWRLLESDDLVHWREKTKRILKSGQYDLYDLTQVGVLNVEKCRFWRVEELPQENIVAPPQLR